MAAAKLERRPSVKWLFSQLDKGNKGKLTEEDIERFTGDREQAKEAFLLLDMDGDGVVSAEDFETGFVKYVRNHEHIRTDCAVEGESKRPRTSPMTETKEGKEEEHFEYDPAAEADLPPPEVSSSMDEFEDGKLKLLRIWRKLGETRPELKEDFERLVTDIGQQLAGAKHSVRKYREEADRRVRELDQDFEQAIQETETRVRSKTFHSLRAKESHYKKQLQKKSWEMETMRQHMQQLESEAHSRRALKQKVNELEQDKRLLEDRLYVESHSESNLLESGMGTGRDSQQQNVRIPMAKLPPGVEAAIGQGITKFRGDFKYSRNDWNRTNVISPNSKSRARSSRSPDGVSGDESSREGTPVGDSEERGGTRLGDDVKLWAREVRRKSSPDPAEISKLLQSMHSGNTEGVMEKPAQQRSGTLSSEASSTSYSGHSRKESSPIIQIEGEIDGLPPSGRGSTLSHSTGDETKRLSLEVSDDSYASPGGSPAAGRRSTLEKKRSDPSSRHRRDASPSRGANLKHNTRGAFSTGPPRSPGRRTPDVSALNQSGHGQGGMQFPASPSKKAARTEVFPQVQFIHMLSEAPDCSFKLLIIGNSGVGKSSFLIRLTENTFSPNYSLTVGVDFKSVHAKVEDKVVSMRIWDTAGQERFKAVTKSYYNDSDGIILMYDITQEHTFLAVREWIDSIKETIGVVPPSLLLLGNKLDCVHTASDRGVSFEAGETMAKIFGAKFLEVSAKTGQNVADAFYTVARQMVQVHENSPGNKRTEMKNISLKQAAPAKSSCCSRS